MSVRLSRFCVTSPTDTEGWKYDDLTLMKECQAAFAIHLQVKPCSPAFTRCLNMNKRVRVTQFF